MDCFKSSGSSGDFQLSQEAGGWWSQGLLCSLQVFLAWGWPPPSEEAGGQTPTFVGTDALTVVDVKSTIQALQGILQSRALNISYLCLRRGKTKGSCFPFSFGGGCSGTPRECQDCNRAITCRESDNNNNNGFEEAVDDFGLIAVEEEAPLEVAIGPVAPLPFSEEDCLASCLASGAGAQECIASCVGPAQVDVETRRPTNNRRPVLKIFGKELTTPSLTGLTKPSSSQETRSSLKEEVAEGTCVTICDNWPHAQCKVLVLEPSPRWS